MDEFSEIHADSLKTGDGGLVVLWSQDQTLFEGKISARGGSVSGNGGLVETSSQGDLAIGLGEVNTFGPQGKYGEWLLDPQQISICSGYGCLDPSCGSSLGDCDTAQSICYLDVGKFNNSSSNVTITAQTVIGWTTNIEMKKSGVGLTLNLCSPNEGSTSSMMGNITTQGGNITLPSNTKAIGGGSGMSYNISSKGGNIVVGGLGVQSTGGSTNVTFDAGGGTVTINVNSSHGQFGSGTLNNVNIVNATSIVTRGITIPGGNFNAYSIPLFLSNGASISGNSLTVGSITGSASSPTSLQLSSNSTTISGSIGYVSSLNATGTTLNVVGSIAATGDITLSNSGSVTVGGTITTTAGNFTYSGTGSLNVSSVDAAKNVSITSTTPTINTSFTAGESISFGNAHSITSSLIAKTGNIVFGDTSNVNGNSQAGGNISFGINPTVAGSFSAGGSITVSGSLAIGGTSSLTSSLGITVGAQISSNGSPNYDLTLDAGSSPISIGGGISNLHSFTIKNAGSVSLFDIGTIGGPISITSPTVTKAPGTINSQGGDITFSGTILPRDNDVGGSLVIYAVGAINLQGLGDSTHYFGDISLTGSAITLGSNINASGTIAIANTSLLMIPTGTMTVGGFTQTGTGPVSLATSIVSTGLISFEGALTILGDTSLQGSKGISIPSSITQNSVNCNLTLNAGSNPMTIKSLGSNAMPFGALSITASKLDLGGDVYSSSSIKIDSPITISSDMKMQRPWWDHFKWRYYDIECNASSNFRRRIGSFNDLRPWK